MAERLGERVLERDADAMGSRSMHVLGDRSNPILHLRFLAEIARRAEGPRFHDDWIRAASSDGLQGLPLENAEE